MTSKSHAELADKCAKVAKQLMGSGHIDLNQFNDIMKAAAILDGSFREEKEEAPIADEAKALQRFNPCWRCTKRGTCTLHSALKSSTNCWRSFDMAIEHNATLERCRLTDAGMTYKLQCSDFDNDDSVKVDGVTRNDWGFF